VIITRHILGLKPQTNLATVWERYSLTSQWRVRSSNFVM